MDATTRLRYLDAMGISVWQRRGLAPAAVEMPEASQDPLDDALAQAIFEPVTELAQNKEGAGPVQQAAVVESPVAAMDWEELEKTVKACTLCPLCEGRTQAVFGVGERTADLMVIGEGPGAEEDRQGLPFVGPAGKLLDAMLAAIGYSRSPGGEHKGAYIANVVKCRPPKNRDPRPEESSACRPYLERQIALLQPGLIMAVGRVAAQSLLGTDAPLGRLRRDLHEYHLTLGNSGNDSTIPVLVTYHPAYLLRSPQEKRKAWEDLKRAGSLLSKDP